MPAIVKLNIVHVFSSPSYKWVPRPNAEREHTPASNYLYEFLRPTLIEYLPGEAECEEAYDVFEYLLALTYLDLLNQEWSPVGRFGWKWGKINPWEGSPPDEFIRTGLDMGAGWPLLKSGFFNGSTDRCKEIVKAQMEWLKGATKDWW